MMGRRAELLARRIFLIIQQSDQFRRNRRPALMIPQEFHPPLSAERCDLSARPRGQGYAFQQFWYRAHCRESFLRQIDVPLKKSKLSQSLAAVAVYTPVVQPTPQGESSKSKKNNRQQSPAPGLR